MTDTQSPLREMTATDLCAAYRRAFAAFEGASAIGDSEKAQELCGDWDKYLFELARRSPANYREAYEMQTIALNSHKMGEWTNYVETDFLDASVAIFGRVTDALKLWSEQRAALAGHTSK